jgi:hypothetical protein
MRVSNQAIWSHLSRQPVRPRQSELSPSSLRWARSLWEQNGTNIGALRDLSKGRLDDSASLAPGRLWLLLRTSEEQSDRPGPLISSRTWSRPVCPSVRSGRVLSCPVVPLISPCWLSWGTDAPGPAGHARVRARPAGGTRPQGCSLKAPRGSRALRNRCETPSKGRRWPEPDIVMRPEKSANAVRVV